MLQMLMSLFWSVFSCVRSKSPYSVRIQENTDQKKLRIWTFLTHWAIYENTIIRDKLFETHFRSSRSQILCNIHRKTPVLESLACSLIKKRLQDRCFPMNVAKFLGIAFLQNTSGGCF